MPTLAPVSPGEILKEEFMEPYGLNANQLAGILDVPANRVTTLIKGTRSITPGTALRLARAFGTTAEFWLNLQSRYDLERARRRDEAAIRKSVKRIRRGSHARIA